MLYLADTSVWSWARRNHETAARLDERVEDGELATCVPVVLELLHSAREAEEYEEFVTTVLEPLEWLPLGAEAGMRAFEVQRALAHTTHGAYRIGATDYLIAAVAESAGEDVVLWHVDRDLGRICDLTGQPQEQERVSG